MLKVCYLLLSCVGRVSQDALQNMTWHEVQNRLREVQKEQQMCIHKAELTELGTCKNGLMSSITSLCFVNIVMISYKFLLDFVTLQFDAKCTCTCFVFIMSKCCAAMKTACRHLPSHFTLEELLGSHGEQRRAAHQASGASSRRSVSARDLNNCHCNLCSLHCVLIDLIIY